MNYDSNFASQNNLTASRLCDSQNETNLISKWSLFYHLPQNKCWDLSSYINVFDSIDTLEKLIAVNDHIPENVIKYCMLFFMLKGVTPMWEDPKNRNGGCFSYKVVNKSVNDVWKELMYLLGENKLTVNLDDMSKVNGITISPKRNFCIIKIWLSDCTIQNPNSITPLENLTQMGCIFKKHEPEF
jgi:Eukaryotic initiation factor 4E